MSFGRQAAQAHLLNGHPIYIAAPDGYPLDQPMRLHPNGRREIVRLDIEAGQFVVVIELEPLSPAQHWWRASAGKRPAR